MKKHPDYIFIFLLSLLVLFGIIMVFSASNAMALKNTNDSFYYVKKHIFYVILGSFFFYFGLNLNFETIRKRSFFLLLGCFFLSLLVFVPGVGKNISGAQRWIDIAGISFQPSEILKIALIIFFSHLLARGREDIKSFLKGPLPIIAVTSIFVLPVLLQPDFGTTLTIFGTMFMMLFITGARFLHLGIILLFSAAASAVLSITSPYRMRRLLSFRDPWSDPLGAGYQIIQSLIAVSSGHVFGLGLGNSKQKFLYLPQQYADFIFAIICEELGLIGASILIVIFILFLARGLYIASRAADFFQSILGSGIILLFAVQGFLNIAVVLGLVPTTGLPLPFISYGGTSIVVSLFAAGIVANLSKGKRIGI